MISALARRIARAIDRGLWAPADRVALAVSGGADSTAMAFLLRELEPRGGWRLAGLIHVNHALRGAESDEDERFCVDLAARLGLPAERALVDVAGRAEATGQSIEAAARDLRYAAFERAADHLGATVVVTGHTADDQAETVLLRLLRGAGRRGVGAIRPRRGLFARPLLECRRAELRAYLAERGEPYREDSSNADDRIPRNRLRRIVMPAIEADWPGGVLALARFAGLAGDDERMLTALAADSGVAVHSSSDGVELIRARLVDLPAPIARRAVRQAIENAGGRCSARDVESVLNLARSGRTAGRLTLYRLVVELRPERIRIAPVRLARAMSPALPFEYRLDVPGTVQIRETGERIRSSFSRGGERPPGGLSAALQSDRLTMPLWVRSRRPGDRFRPLGAPGGRKLQDVLVDRKVPVSERDRVAVVTDHAGRIVWVSGVAIAHECRVTEPEAGMVILDLERKTKDNQ
jgi:tRNA(Ile)-lysidine synthase